MPSQLPFPIPLSPPLSILSLSLSLQDKHELALREVRPTLYPRVRSVGRTVYECSVYRV